MSSDALLNAVFILWTLITLACFVAYQVDGRSRQDAWQRIADERRRLAVARKTLDALILKARDLDTLARLDDYLQDDSGPDIH
jgi:hypothetical protein